MIVSCVTAASSRKKIPRRDVSPPIFPGRGGCDTGYENWRDSMFKNILAAAGLIFMSYLKN